MKNSIGIRFVYALLIAVFAFSGFAAPSVRAAEEPGTIVDVALAANAQSGEFSILIAALQAANQDVIGRLSSDREFTVFAPTDAAFTALLAELNMTPEELLGDKAMVSRILRYHIVKGALDSSAVISRERIRTVQGGLLFQDGGVLTDAQGRTSNIIDTDIQASNGYIHVIDRVVLPKPIRGSIVEVTRGANAGTGEFSILLAALQAANPSIIESLSGRGPYTVFAPTDAAFTALLGELGLTAEELLSNRALVTRVLRYHIVKGDRLEASEVLSMDRIRTWQGGWLFQEGGVLTDANGRTANIIATDIKANNGIIHVIDAVVLPKMR